MGTFINILIYYTFQNIYHLIVFKQNTSDFIYYKVNLYLIEIKIKRNKNILFFKKQFNFILLNLLMNSGLFLYTFLKIRQFLIRKY